MWLVVGLGNPGAQYALTRHNIGFMALDAYIKGLFLPNEKEQFKGLLTKFKFGEGSEAQEVIFLKPQTFMNLSGESVKPCMDFFKIPLENLIVIHDEVDIPFNTMRIQKNRGHGGHNGIKSITQQCGSMDYIRLRLGVGRPAHPDFSVADYVLGKFTNEEFKEMPAFLQKSFEAVESIIFDGFAKAATKFNV